MLTKKKIIIFHTGHCSCWNFLIFMYLIAEMIVTPVTQWFRWQDIAHWHLCTRILQLNFVTYCSSGLNFEDNFPFHKFYFVFVTSNCSQTLQPNCLTLQHFYILIMDEKVLVLCEKWLSKFSSNLYVLRPPESEKWFLRKCLSVCRSCAA